MSSNEKLLIRLGKNIRFLRKERGLTQEILAERCHYDPTYISLLERGKRNPAFLTLVNIASCLECRVGDLTDRDSQDMR